ncbi:MAG TPA: hypothetical protein VGO56_12850 [Pyrinomonadaceae bacterium]|jgi:hypothetical protein|nr:hypothetical protein [Pyrinomonadaceae bacterium]
MSFPFNEIEFKRNAVQPVECIKAGWELIKTQYWLFVGMTFVAMFVGGLVPFGILLGPLYCGLYLALFKIRRGEPIEFGTLFKGFDYFGDAAIAALLHALPMFLIIAPAYILYIVGMFTMMGTSRNGQPDPAAALGFFGIFGVIWIIIVVLLIVLTVVFTFAYPLIVDRRLSGLNAVKLSIKASLANFWRLLALMFLVGLLSSLGVLLCIVGVYLIIPISFGAIAVAYEQVFGLNEQSQPAVPPPPPSFV